MVGALSQETLNGCLPGIIGDLGYRPESGAEVKGTVYLSAGGEVVVEGTIVVRVSFDCARCLASRSTQVELSESHVLVRRKPDRDGDREFIVSNEDEHPVEETFEGDEIDLNELFRQDLLLSLPMNPSCEFAGNDECVLDDGAAKAMEKPMDPRWAPLLELKKKLD
jgi:uncharacterized metal-binding protein YceD (DUF177 family)